jgi:hypothetical protein
MAFINKEPVEAGDTPSASDLNAPYSSLETLTINKNNTANNWATRAHYVAPAMNIIRSYDNVTTSAWTTSTENTWETITVLGQPAEIANINTTPGSDSILRVSASGLIGDITLVNDGDGQGTEDSYNYFGFRILMTYNTGGSPLLPISVAEAGYSFNSKARRTIISYGVTPEGSNWRSFSFSDILLITNPSLEIEKLELQTIVGSNGGAGNTLAVTRHNIQAIISKH